MAITGSINGVVGRVVHGWAIDTAQPEAAIAVSIWANGQPVAEGMTGLPGHAPTSPEHNGCGFELVLDSRFERAGPVRYELRIGDQAIAIRHVDYAPSVSQTFLGGVELASPTSLGGWAVNLEQPDLPVTLVIQLGIRFVGAVQTVHSRPDVQARFGVNQPGGFVYNIPGPLRTRATQVFRVLVANTQVEIGGSPLVVPVPARGLSYEGAEALFGVR
jgi:hypothetical protein